MPATDPLQSFGWLDDMWSCESWECDPWDPSVSRGLKVDSADLACEGWLCSTGASGRVGFAAVPASAVGSAGPSSAHAGKNPPELVGKLGFSVDIVHRAVIDDHCLAPLTAVTLLGCAPREVLPQL